MALSRSSAGSCSSRATWSRSTRRWALLIDEQLTIEDASIMAGFGAIFAAVAGFLTLTLVWLVGARWLIVPAFVFAVAFARGLYLDAVYPPPGL